MSVSLYLYIICAVAGILYRYYVGIRFAALRGQEALANGTFENFKLFSRKPLTILVGYACRVGTIYGIYMEV